MNIREKAQELIEALYVIKEMCDSADRIWAFSRLHPNRESLPFIAEGANRVATLGRDFLANLEKEDETND